MKNITLMSSAELRAEKARLTGTTSERGKKRLYGIVRELNSRFDHLSAIWSTTSIGRPFVIRRTIETI
jgi:hypothetical protein